MEKLIKALSILSNYLKDYNRNYPTSCEHDTLFVCGVDLERMNESTVKELIECGFIPGSDQDTCYDWSNFTQEDWEVRRLELTDCFYSYKYGSC